MKKDEILSSIEISNENSGLLRNYELNYKDAAFAGELLTDIVERTADGAILNNHSFEYNELGLDYRQSWENDFQGKPWSTGTAYYSVPYTYDLPGESSPRP
jgi:hypothetical protein